MSQYQHGDVLIVSVGADVSGMRPVAPVGGRLILAEGESTGHAHAIVADPDVELFEDESGTLFLRCAEPKTIVHEEHHAIEVAPGTYEIGIVVEVDPFEEEVRRVVD